MSKSDPSLIMAVLTIVCDPPCFIGIVHKVQPQMLQKTLCFGAPLRVPFSTYVVVASSPFTTFSCSALYLADYYAVSILNKLLRQFDYNLIGTSSVFGTMRAIADEDIFRFTRQAEFYCFAQAGPLLRNVRHVWEKL